MLQLHRNGFLSHIASPEILEQNIFCVFFSNPPSKFRSITILAMKVNQHLADFDKSVLATQKSFAVVIFPLWHCQHENKLCALITSSDTTFYPFEEFEISKCYAVHLL